jgi:uncharacterized protein
MLSFPKLVVLVAVVAIVWFGFRWLERVERARRRAAERSQARLGRERQSPIGRGETQEMKACPVCGTYVAATARACSRADCPFPAL